MYEVVNVNRHHRSRQDMFPEWWLGQQRKRLFIARLANSGENSIRVHPRVAICRFVFILASPDAEN